MSRLRPFPFPVALLALLPACQGPGVHRGEEAALPTIADFAAAAEEHEVVLELPRFEQSPAEVDTTVDGILARADERLARYAAQDPERATFASAIAALDDILYPVLTVQNRMYLMKETRQEEDMRAACTAAVDRINEWLVAFHLREDVYRICRAFADAYESGRRPRLAGEDRKLYRDTMRDWRRQGLELDAAARAEVGRLRNELNRLETEFDTNITETQETLFFTADELAGVPDSFLTASRQPDGRHAVRVTVTPDYLTVMENCSVAETRRLLNRARYSLAMAENGPLLDRMVETRRRLAELLGYDSWADYQIEPRMARTAERAIGFVEDLIAGLEPKFTAEVEELRRLKAEETGDPEAEILWWDFRYYQHQLMKQRYQVDSEALRVFFPLERVLDGMFTIYQRIFGLRFTEIDPGYRWVADLRAFVVSDAASGEPLGLFYLDLFPRPGKYNHFAQFDVVGGKRLSDGRYLRPVAALVCNFTPGVGDEPSLMSHDEVETIFHEFGHAMHTILTRARYATFAGANVPRDFVEAPSQMLENWVWDPEVLALFAADWRNPSRRLPAETIRRMREADLATKAVYYRRQLALALTDLRLHTAPAGANSMAIGNSTSAEVLFEPPAGTNFCAYWGHLTGYDAGYYGYAWADAIAADLATAFEQAPDGFLDVATGLRLRREIYEVGGARDAEESIRRFLGRERSNAAFLKSLGID
ncbi:MAG: hypothetical protein D6702_05420 [Planctomycetota bacterium]|nr:MAG: hypothetical protein D6702_05420 [Planctomycetota bacterium]